MIFSTVFFYSKFIAVSRLFIHNTVKLSVNLCCLFCSAGTMDTYVSLLQTYSGRDKILRTVSYVASLLSGSVKKEETATKLVTVARQISNSRVVLRFFDDILMWRITKHLSVEVCCNESQFCLLSLVVSPLVSL